MKNPFVPPHTLFATPGICLVNTSCRPDPNCCAVIGGVLSIIAGVLFAIDVAFEVLEDVFPTEALELVFEELFPADPVVEFVVELSLFVLFYVTPVAFVAF